MDENFGRTRAFFKVVGKGFKDFCEHTPIHGVPYTGQGGRKPVERILWVGILLIATSLCSYLIYKSHKKWMETPVLVDFKTEVVNIWEIPFPAVTICPGFLAFSPDDDMDYCTKKGSRLLMSLICAFGGNGRIELPEMKPDCNLDDVLKEALLAISDNKSTSFLFLQQDVSYDMLLTEFGLCFTFNLLDPNDIFKEEVISFEFTLNILIDTPNSCFNSNILSSSAVPACSKVTPNNEDSIVIESLLLRKSNINRTTNWKLSKGYESLNMTFPFRAFGAGVSDSLIGVLSDNRDTFDESCDTSHVEGFLIMLHSPIEYPSSDKEVITGAANSSIIVYVKPKAIYASEDIESILIAKRRCYFEHESNLRFFKYYTETNCQLECLSNYTYKICNCVPPHLPRSRDMKLCETLEGVKCSQNAPSSLIEVQFQNRYKSDSCNCLPNCNELTYESETVFSSNKGTFLDGVNVGTIFVYFWESEFWPATRSRLYSLMEFLADCGGLMGLCMGVSFVSLIEILYHCTIRHVPKKRKSYEVKTNEEHTEEVDITAL